MRTTHGGFFAAVLIAGTLVGSACGGASSSSTLQNVHYKTDMHQAFTSVTQAVTGADYQVAHADENTGVITTVPKWFSSDGMSETAGQGGINLTDGALEITLNVLVTKDATDASTVSVAITPSIRRHVAGRMNFDDVKPDDLSLPGWFHGKLDKVSDAIRDQLRPFEAKPAPAGGAGAMPPPGATAGPAASPATPSPSPTTK